MSFYPQNSFWSSDDLTISGGATIDNADYKIVDGVMKYIPNNFSGQVTTWDSGPWIGPQLWCIENGLDTYAGTTEDINIYTGTTGLVYFSDYGEGQALITEIPSLTTGAWYPGLSAYPTGFGVFQPGACALIGKVGFADYPCENGGSPGAEYKHTYDFDIRVFEGENPQVQNTDGLGLTGLLYPSVVIGSFNFGLSSDEVVIVEPRPDGIRVHNKSGAFLPADMTSKARRVRIAADLGSLEKGSNKSDLYIGLDDGTSMYVPDCGRIMTGAFSQDVTVSFGAPPLYGGGPGSIGSASHANAPFSTEGPNTTFFTDLTPILDPLGISGIAGFSGRTMWDNLKVNMFEAVLKHPANELPAYATEATGTIYTDEWKVNPESNGYLGAWVSWKGGVGDSRTTVEAQYYKYQSNGNGIWTSVPETLTTISGFGDGSSSTVGLEGKRFIDLTRVPFYSVPNVNQIRFKCQGIPNGFPVPEIDDFFIVASNPAKEAEFHPNWKLSTIPQTIRVNAKEDKFFNEPYPAHHYDEIYFHNELGLKNLPVSTQLEGVNQTGGPTGFIRTNADIFDFTAKGFQSSDASYYDAPAWKNFAMQGAYTGTWDSSSFSAVSTGIFDGDILDHLSYYPTNADYEEGTSGIAQVILDVEEYTSLNGDLAYAQHVTVYDYTGAADENNIYGVVYNQIEIPATPQKVMAVVEGTIQIPNGPGVYCRMMDQDSQVDYFLDGKNYREPGRFAFARYVDSDRTSVSTGNYIAFGVKPRPGLAESITEADKWSGWVDAINTHAADKFILFGTNGYIADHSWAEYGGISGHNYRHTPLDNSILFHTGLNWEALEDLNNGMQPPATDSFLMEGWFKPYGITGTNATSGLLFSCGNPNYNGVTNLGVCSVYLHTDGRLSAISDFAGSHSSWGISGGRYYYMGKVGSNTYLSTGETDPVILDESTSPKVKWGEWNHIGFVMDQKIMGDTFSGMNQPFLHGEEEAMLHGARAQNIYLTLNGKVCALQSFAASPYTKRLASSPDSSSIFPYGTDDNASQAWPSILCMGLCSDGVTSEDTYLSNIVDRQLTLGKEVMCEMDHVRFGIRDRADLRSDVIIKGAKEHLPTFVPYDAPKVAKPETGSFRHMETVHIYRMDYDGSYPYWDEGYSPVPMFFENHDLVDGEIENYGLDSSSFVTTVEGPKGRNAVRLGPGANLKLEHSVFDTVLSIGTGSWTMVTDTYALSAADDAAIRLLGERFEDRHSNSRYAAGGYFKLHRYPESASPVVMDIITTDFRQINGAYGQSQIYLGVDHTGAAVFGTRKSFDTTNSSCIGPFTGNTKLELETWYHIGFDANLAETPSDPENEGGYPFFKVYIDGELDSDKELNLVNPDDLPTPAGPNSGVAFAFPTPSTNNGTTRIGGSVPVGQADRPFRYDYGDISVADFFYSMPFTRVNGSVDWANFAAPSGEEITGHGEKAFVDITTEIAEIYGTGDNGNASPYTGQFVYPATNFTGGGQKLLFVTAAGGNDWEGILKAGMALFGDGNFMDAQSYYAIYEGGNSDDVLGSTDSPIQIGQTVPPLGINLALISNREWSSDTAVTTFDLSDENFNNITNKFLGSTTIGQFGSLDNTLAGDSNPWNALVSSEIDSQDIRVSSLAIESPKAGSEHIGYFCHLIGGEDKGMYLPNAFSHVDATGSTGNYLSNLQRVRDAISIKNVNGDNIPFEKFPFTVIASPYGPDKDISAITGENALGFGTGYNTDLSNDNGTFTVVLVAEEQTIGETVFIHYPSIAYSDGKINLQDSEVYNPAPTMRRQIDVYTASGVLDPGTGYYTIGTNGLAKNNTVYIWWGDLNV